MLILGYTRIISVTCDPQVVCYICPCYIGLVYKGAEKPWKVRGVQAPLKSWREHIAYFLWITASMFYCQANSPDIFHILAWLNIHDNHRYSQYEYPWIPYSIFPNICNSINCCCLYLQLPSSYSMAFPRVKDHSLFLEQMFCIKEMPDLIRWYKSP